MFLSHHYNLPDQDSQDIYIYCTMHVDTTDLNWNYISWQQRCV